MLRIGRTGDRAFLHFKTDADQESGILFGDVDDDVECAIEYEPANKALTFSTNNNTETMRLDSSGNVSIGNSSVAFPSGEGLQVYSASNPRIKLANSTTGVASGDGTQFYLDGADVIYDNKDAGNQRWYTGGAERMRIRPNGDFGVGRDPGVGGTTDYGHDFYSSGHYYQYVNGSGDVDAYRIYNSSGTNTAAIDCDGDYHDLSDERYKENIVDASSVLDTIISKIKVRSFNWKEDGRKQSYGFIAQELNEVAPEAVSPPQDDEDVWGVKHAKIVPMLTKAIQEQQTLIETLQAEVKALKGE